MYGTINKRYIFSVDLPDDGVNLVDNAGQEPSLYKCNSKPRYNCIFAYRLMTKDLIFEASLEMNVQKSTLTNWWFRLLVSDMTQHFKYAILKAFKY